MTCCYTAVIFSVKVTPVLLLYGIHTVTRIRVEPGYTGQSSFILCCIAVIRHAAFALFYFINLLWVNCKVHSEVMRPAVIRQSHNGQYQHCCYTACDNWHKVRAMSIKTLESCSDPLYCCYTACSSLPFCASVLCMSYCCVTYSFTIYVFWLLCTHYQKWLEI